MSKLVSKININFNALNGCPIPAPEEFYVANGEHASIENLQYVQKALKKLYQYEQMEDKGLLINLPCKIGDITYYPSKFSNKILKMKIEDIVLKENNIFFDVKNISFPFNSFSVTLDDFNEIIFTTKEKAIENLNK